MDEITLLRAMRADAGSPTDATIEAGRTKLLQSITPAAAPTRIPARRPRRTRIWLTSAAAAAVVAALIGGDVIGLAGWRGGATARAAEVLNNAAQTTIKTVDPVVGPGQYMRIKSTNVWSSASVAADGFTYQWLDTEKFDMYIPANRATEWVWQR